jgi:hypothetical protein
MAKKPLSKYRKITDKSVEDDYEHNVWRAIEDIWVEMYYRQMSPPEIKDKIMFLVHAYIQFMEQEAEKDLHKMSAHKRRKFR